MPETAKILPFPTRVTEARCDREEASARAKAYLSVVLGDRSDKLVRSTLGDGDVLTALCGQLWDLSNTDPVNLAAEAPALHKGLSAQPEGTFFFDERDFFLGEAALLAAGGFRLMGKREETERWLGRADASFRHTVAPEAHLARVAYVRLALRYDTRDHEEVLELVPSIARTFQKLGMDADLAKCRFLEAMSLKELGRIEEAASGLERLALTDDYRVEPSLRGMALLNLGNLRSEQGSLDQAFDSYKRALPLLQASNRLVALADLKLMLGGTLQRMGRFEAATSALRDSVKDCVILGATARAAYVRVVLAQVLLEAGQPREAEWELLAALPTIDEEGMVPEGFVAVALLRESVRQRRTDPNALVELREYLQAKN